MKKLYLVLILFVSFSLFAQDTAKRISLSDIDNPYNMTSEQLASFIRSTSPHGKCIQLSNNSMTYMFVYLEDFLQNDMKYSSENTGDTYPNDKTNSLRTKYIPSISSGRINTKRLDFKFSYFKVDPSNTNNFISSVTITGDYSSIVKFFTSYWTNISSLEEIDSKLVLVKTFIEDEITLSFDPKRSIGTIKIINKVFPKKEDFIAKLQ